MTDIEDCKNRWNLLRNAGGYTYRNHPALHETVARLIAIAETQPSPPKDDAVIKDTESNVLIGVYNTLLDIQDVASGLNCGGTTEAILHQQLGWLTGWLSCRIDGVKDLDWPEETDDDE